MKQSFRPHGLTIFLALITLAIPVFCLAAETKSRSDIPSPYVPDALVALASDSAIVVDKTLQRLYVFQPNGEGFKTVYETTCSTGKKQGMKLQSGDQRTPEGIYYPRAFFPDESLTPIYGAMAYDLDYPNLIDKKEGKNGHNIWMHGTDRPLTPYQSNGCVTLENTDISTISKYITLNETPVIILDYIKWVPPDISTRLRGEVSGIIGEWSDDIRRSDARGLNALYEPEAKFNRKLRSRLLHELAVARKNGASVDILPDRLSILKHDTYTVITFEPRIVVGKKSYTAGMKKFFLRKKFNSWYIDDEISFDPDKEQTLVAELSAFNQRIASIEEMRGVLATWISSWKAGNIDQYAAFYADDFKSKGMNREQWIDYKREVSQRSADIDIVISNLAISGTEDAATVSFTQQYRSSILNDVGIKTLRMRKIGESWQIFREFWQAIEIAKVTEQ